MNYIIEEILKRACNEFEKTYNVEKFCNGIGIGIGNEEIGLSLFFETTEKFNAFPFKEAHFEGIPIYKEVIGVMNISHD